MKEHLAAASRSPRAAITSRARQPLSLLVTAHQHMSSCMRSCQSCEFMSEELFPEEFRKLQACEQARRSFQELLVLCCGVY